MLISISFGAEVVLAARTIEDAVRFQLARGLPVLVELHVEEDIEVGVQHHRGLSVRLNGLPLPVLLAAVGHLSCGILTSRQCLEELHLYRFFLKTFISYSVVYKTSFNDF